MIVKVVIVVLFCLHVQCVPPSPTSAVTDMLQAEFSTMKNTVKVLSDQWEKWNTLFITSLEPRITSTASTLASIDSNIHNLQERAHVWDTFQLHVSAWNEQLASLDRKMDIISKGQEKVLALDGKINSILNMEYKLDNTMKTLNNLYDSVANLDTTVYSKKNHDTLFSEFATRGVLSSIKLVEKKLDRLLLANQNTILKTKGTGEKPKFTIKCTTPRMIEDLLNDISSKVDVIFDNISRAGDDVEDNDYDNEYLDVREGSGEAVNYKQLLKNKRLRKAIKNSQPFKYTAQALEEILDRTIRIENATLIILDKENTNFEKLSAEFKENCNYKTVEQMYKNSVEFTKNINFGLESYFSEQRAHFESIFHRLNKKCYTTPWINNFLTTRPTIKTTTTTIESINSEEIFEITTAKSTLFDNSDEMSSDLNNSQKHDSLDAHNSQPTWKPIINQNKSSCGDLDVDDGSGVYMFGNRDWENTELFYNKRYCVIRNDGLWTVIQRRDNYSLQNNFNVSWDDYKYGFGDLHRDFWMGNDFLYKASNSSNLILRIELEDFENNAVWAEYSTFIVLPESDNYQLIVDGYIGNASDSFSSHNGSFFSTFDKTNDAAPECCPCAVSYGGGWWFHRCFESNLNGVYYKRPNENNYFRGIIWEHWLGNYSLKKSVMMVKSKGQVLTSHQSHSMSDSDTIPYYEDP